MRPRKQGRQLSFAFMRGKKPVQKIQKIPFAMKNAGKAYFLNGKNYFEVLKKSRLRKGGQKVARFGIVNEKKKEVAFSITVSPLPNLKKIIEEQRFPEWKKAYRELFAPKTAYFHFGAEGGTGEWIKAFDSEMFHELFRSAINYSKKNGIRRLVSTYGGKRDYIVRSNEGVRQVAKIESIFRKFGFSHTNIELESFWYKDI